MGPALLKMIKHSDYPKSLISRINEVNVFSIKYRFSGILLIKHKLHLSQANHTYHVNMVSVTSASRYITSVSRYHLRYQSRSSMYICGLNPWNFSEAVSIGFDCCRSCVIRAFPGNIHLRIADTVGETQSF